MSLSPERPSSNALGHLIQVTPHIVPLHFLLRSPFSLRLCLDSLTKSNTGFEMKKKKKKNRKKTDGSFYSRKSNVCSVLECRDLVQTKLTSNTGSDPKCSCLHFGEKCKYFCVYQNQMKRLVCSLKLYNLLLLETFHMEKMSFFLSPLLPMLFLVTSPSSFLSITGSGEESVCV